MALMAGFATPYESRLRGLTLACSGCGNIEIRLLSNSALIAVPGKTVPLHHRAHCPHDNYAMFASTRFSGSSVLCAFT